MEEFFLDLTRRLEAKTSFLSKDIEADHKQLISNSYKCMANCFATPNIPLPESTKCAESCHFKVKTVQEKIQASITEIQEKFTQCTDACGLHSARYESEHLKECAKVCTQNALKEFDTLAGSARNIFREYLD
jgi:hypothetical protein